MLKRGNTNAQRAHGSTPTCPSTKSFQILPGWTVLPELQICCWWPERWRGALSVPGYWTTLDREIIRVKPGDGDGTEMGRRYWPTRNCQLKLRPEVFQARHFGVATAQAPPGHRLRRRRVAWIMYVAVPGHGRLQSQWTTNMYLPTFWWWERCQMNGWS